MAALRALAARVASAIRASRFCSASVTMEEAIFWAASRVLRMASSDSRYSAILSTVTFSLAFSAAFSLNRAE